MSEFKQEKKVHLLMGEWTDSQGRVGTSIIHEGFLDRETALLECAKLNKEAVQKEGGKFHYYLGSVPLNG